VDGYRAASGSIALSIANTPSPVNDNFANRTALSGTSSTVNGSNVGATSESGEPSNANVSGGRSVWWSWTAPASGTVTVSTAGSQFDTTLGVYAGSSVSGLTVVASNDDETAGTLTSRVVFAAVAGQTYQVSVDGYRGANGSIALSIDVAPPPVNDNFANRTILIGTSVTASGSNWNATSEPGEPNNAGISGGRSVWWSWTAPDSGTVTISTAGSQFDTTLGIYTGSNVSGLSAVASNDDESGSLLTSRVTLSVVAGVTYHILVDGYRGAAGNITLHISL
jgi:hypothetical protein